MFKTNAVTKRYGPITALEEVSIDVEPGAITGVLGPNGSGKSTLFRILLGLTPPDHGKVTLWGQPQGRGATPERRRIVYVPDSDALYEDLTPRELARLTWNVHARLDPTADGGFPFERFESLVDVFGLDEHSDRRCRDLSHGTRRKAQLVAALTCRPSAMVVDEPTNGLDPDQHVVLRLVLSSLAASGSTILLSTHNLGFAESLCDSVVLLRSRVVMCGSPDHVLRATGATSLADAYERLTGIDRGAIARQANEAFQ
jgi:ABC-2 type transport system ATP-binding protein